MENRVTDRQIGPLESITTRWPSAPVHQLPVEVLIHIVQQVLHPHKTIENYYRNLRSLSGVCSYWNLAIRNSPQLWTKISIDSTEAAVKKVLERGSSRALNVECMYINHHRSDDRVLHLSELVGATANRWRSLVMVFRWHSFSDSVRRILQLQAPNLEMVSLEDDDWETDLSDIELFGGISPKLKEVRLTAVKCQWPQSAFKGLETLYLGQPELDSMEVLLGMLRDCPQLHSLELWRCHFATDPSENVPPVSLPKLKHLSLHFYTHVMAPILEKVLHHIQAPLHCALHVNLTFARDVENIVKVTLMDWLVGRQCNDVLESLHSLEIRFGHAGFGSGPLYFTLSGSARIHGSFDSGGWKSFSQVLERISRVIKCSTARRFVTSLKLGGYATSPYFLGTADFAAQLGQIGPITHLEMEQYAKATDSDIIWEALRGTNPHLSSAFSTVRNLVFRDMRPEDIDGLVNTALNPSKARQSLTSGDQVKTLDNVEIHVEGRAFEVAEILAKELRKDSRIGKVLLYVSL